MCFFFQGLVKAFAIQARFFCNLCHTSGTRHIAKSHLPQLGVVGIQDFLQEVANFLFCF
jgi:hypothetical protein